MRKSRYADEQMVKILREADRSPVADVAKKHGVSEQTIYVWRKRFGTMTADETKRRRTLEQENSRLKKLVAERDLEIEVMKEIAAKNGERVRSTAAGRVRIGARSLAATSVRAITDGKVGTPLRVEESGEGRRRCDEDGRARAAVPTLRLPAHPGLPRPRRAQDEQRPDVSPVAEREAAGAEEAAAATCGRLSTEGDRADGSEPGLG
jgi:putative transposase